MNHLDQKQGNSKSMIDELDAADLLQDSFNRIKSELHKVIIGHESVIEETLIALFARGHCLLVGVPGLAKTLLVRTLAKCLDLEFRRIQFTPDLMPSDITGTELIQQDDDGHRSLRFMPGPVFGNIVLADEINRTPPKTQAALLEAMQERQITVGGERLELPDPFFVLATQNPIEQEGTYPLPEAQLDRFIFSVAVDYPSEDEEIDIVMQLSTEEEVTINPILTGTEFNQLYAVVRRVPIATHVARYAVQLVRLSRPLSPSDSEFTLHNITWGAGPRASQYLVLAAKARALLYGRNYVDIEDIHAVAKPVLRHRIRISFSAESEGLTADDVIDELIALVPSVSDEPHGSSLSKVFRSPDAS